MEPFEIWAKALGVEESSDNAEAWGDQGQACGRWQMHPAFFDRWRVPAKLGWTWDDWFRASLEKFWQAAQSEGRSDLEAAMGFHLHGDTSGSPDDDPAYAQRFLANLQAAKGGSGRTRHTA